jgi:hypothetical protein
VSDTPKLASFLRRLLPYLSVAIVIAVLYDGAVFYSRWSSARDTEKSQAAKRSEQARQTLEMLGGDHLKILDFYANPGTIRRGQQANICYGVNAADRVRIDPPVEDVHPAVSHCVQVAPLHTTGYKLSAQDRAGHTATATLTVQVAP